MREFSMSLGHIVYLSPTFRPYRVPVFDEISRRVGEGFTVVTHGGQRRATGHRAFEMGQFRRKFVFGWHFRFAAGKSSAGRATPMGAYISPALPFVLAGLRPQVVISNNYGTWTLLALLMGFPTVIFWEGTTHTERTVKPWRLRLRQWMARRSKAHVVNGRAAREYLQNQLGVAEDRIFEGGMCADPVPNRLQPVAPRRARTGEPIRFMFVGQLIQRKGPEQLIRAAAELKAMAPSETGFEIVMLGSGADKPALQELASSLGVGDVITFHDYVPPDEVWDIYQCCHVFVLPTRQDNWPLVVPEAMSMGMPVLLSKHAGSAPDLIREGENGHLFEPADEAELARLMVSYLGTPELVERQGARSLDLVAPYTPERAADAFLAGLSR